MNATMTSADDAGAQPRSPDRTQPEQSEREEQQCVAEDAGPRLQDRSEVGRIGQGPGAQLGPERAGPRPENSGQDQDAQPDQRAGRVDLVVDQVGRDEPPGMEVLHLAGAAPGARRQAVRRAHPGQPPGDERPEAGRCGRHQPQDHDGGDLSRRERRPLPVSPVVTPAEQEVHQDDGGEGQDDRPGQGQPHDDGQGQEIVPLHQQQQGRGQQQQRERLGVADLQHRAGREHGDHEHPDQGGLGADVPFEELIDDKHRQGAQHQAGHRAGHREAQTGHGHDATDQERVRRVERQGVLFEVALRVVGQRVGIALLGDLAVPRPVPLHAEVEVAGVS